MTRTCEACRGTGEPLAQRGTWYVATAICGYCSGTGERPVPESREVAGVAASPQVGAGVPA